MPRHTMRCQVRWSDMDAFGHVNNARFLTLFEEARTALILDGGEALSGLLDGCVVIRHEIDYLRPVTYRRDPVRVDCWVTDVRHASFGVGYEMFDHEGKPAARAISRLSPISLPAGRPRRLLPEEREFLDAWRVES
ncbi:acyl-CoA thioesterase [Cryptosporangium minutisporangium]|uniref:Thioesterase family protein n=1 Tax=Cryptosporangium minutisporangium TaxID=113569 RepID=A0ABP6T6J3_9ACTN